MTGTDLAFDKKQLVDLSPLDTSKFDRWWEEYPRESSVSFTYENSGRREQLAPPYREVDHDNGVSIIQVVPGWTIVGYTLEAPFKPQYESVAIMFEASDGWRVWWHFSKW